MKLYTIIFMLSERTTFAQIRAETPYRAFAIWADAMRIRQGSGHPFPDGLAVAEELIPHLEFANVWHSSASEGEQFGMVHVVQTDEPDKPAA